MPLSRAAANLINKVRGKMSSKMRYDAKEKTIKPMNPQVKQMKETLENNRKAGKYSSGRGVGY